MEGGEKGNLYMDYTLCIIFKLLKREDIFQVSRNTSFGFKSNLAQYTKYIKVTNEVEGAHVYSKRKWCSWAGTLVRV